MNIIMLATTLPLWWANVHANKSDGLFEKTNQTKTTERIFYIVYTNNNDSVAAAMLNANVSAYFTADAVRYTNNDMHHKDDDDNDKNDVDENIDNLFAMILEEMNKIKKNEDTDYSYTKIIMIILCLLLIFSLKTKMYRLSQCFKKKHTNNSNKDNALLEKITIQEFNYNVNAANSPSVCQKPTVDSIKAISTRL
ncbi:hypothetical protein [Lambdina fiscellaria nucleopolyhedrovirus]|uniref:Uncharacterized protein n=1 Tax=Lambdina fiscellaria nucleopolyhedrovirus TaxID=1642929 RepID=A0A0E3Z881_9ABAC|nr:hypothetical protein [Lambdina fiscellaria nucleopolyhedrovirus]AKC91633.1 hypothetical protein [Lambdina fiscellaria nucleopolyhedrovirus]